MDTEDLKSVRLKNTIANFVVPLVAILISMVLIGLVIYPSISSIPETEQELNAAVTLRNQLDTKVNKLNTLLDFKSSIDENLSIMSDALYSEPSVPELLTQIDAIAREAGLEVRKLSYSISEVKSGTSDNATAYEVVSVSLGAAGTYDQLVVFLGNLENAARLVNVSTIRLAQESDSGVYTANIVITSPYVEVTTAADTDKPITFDINDPEFQDLMSKVKALRVYDINLDEIFTEIKETNEEGEVVVLDTEPEVTEDEGLLEEVPVIPLPVEPPVEEPLTEEPPEINPIL